MHDLFFAAFLACLCVIALFAALQFFVGILILERMKDLMTRKPIEDDADTEEDECFGEDGLEPLVEALRQEVRALHERVIELENQGTLAPAVPEGKEVVKLG